MPPLPALEEDGFDSLTEGVASLAALEEEALADGASEEAFAGKDDPSSEDEAGAGGDGGEERETRDSLDVVIPKEFAASESPDSDEPLSHGEPA
jgi:hypothetical protein